MVINNQMHELEQKFWNYINDDMRKIEEKCTKFWIKFK